MNSFLTKQMLIRQSDNSGEVQRPREYRGGTLNTDWGGQEGSPEEVSLGRLGGAIHGKSKEGSYGGGLGRKNKMCKCPKGVSVCMCVSL